MKKIKLITIITILCLSRTNAQPWMNTSLKPEERTELLLSQMTLEEKVGQMTQITLDVLTEGPDIYTSNEPIKIDKSSLNKAIQKYAIGSVLNTANNRARTVNTWHYIISEIQKETYKTRLKIPVIYGVDAIHGTTYTEGATFFPQQIGMAASFNPDLVKEAAEITAYETRASNIPWDFSPVLDLGIDPRNPRMWETFGEDPYLNQIMGLAVVQGYEGEGKEELDKYHVASCLKHFIGYGNSFSGKDRTPAQISENQLREIHLPAFKQAIEAGAESIMINSGITNGIPIHSDKRILTDLLRKELKFDGLVVTDWADIENLHNRDKVAETHKKAVELAINAGIDMSMVPYNFDFIQYLIELVNEGKITEERIDESVRRILRLKFKLGLFEKPYYPVNDYKNFASNDFIETAKQLSAESITLLKNNKNILPLSKDSKILVVGPNANSMRTLNGGWSYSWQGEKVEEFAQKYNTVLEAFKNKIGKNNVAFSAGVNYKMDGLYHEELTPNFDEALHKAKEVDYIILVLGENSYTEKPGDLDELKLSDNQENLALELAKTGKPIILILNEGRPRLIKKIDPKMDAIIQAYLPGNYGGDAIADIVFGDINPSGKLPYSYPKFSNSIINYFYKPSENQEKMSGAYDYASNLAMQYEFGHGLSYTSFEYSELELSSDSMSYGDKLQVSVKVKNTGKIAGKEVVLLFTKDHYASITPDNKRLRRFQKIHLKPGETKQLKFILNVDDLSFINRENIRVTEPGKFSIIINQLEKEFTFQ